MMFLMDQKASEVYKTVLQELWTNTTASLNKCNNYCDSVL